MHDFAHGALSTNRYALHRIFSKGAQVTHPAAFRVALPSLFGPEGSTPKAARPRGPPASASTDNALALSWRPAKNAAGGPRQRRFPLQFSPLWNPPFLIPPFKADHAKGGKPQGDTARLLSREDVRRPTGCRDHSAASPLRHGPRRAGRVGRGSAGVPRPALLRPFVESAFPMIGRPGEAPFQRSEVRALPSLFFPFSPRRFGNPGESLPCGSSRRSRPAGPPARKVKEKGNHRREMP